MTNPLRVLVAGCGNMGASHARAYHKMPEFEIVGLVSRGPASRGAISKELGGVPGVRDYYQALAATTPRRRQHQYLSRDALRPMRWRRSTAGCHVFCEKPLAETVAEAQAHRGRRARQAAGSW